MLFNYFKYYEMVKQNICEKAHKALSTYNDALTTNNALQIKNETAKKRAAKVSSAFQHSPISEWFRMDVCIESWCKKTTSPF